jgi:hypothetical protein
VPQFGRTRGPAEHADGALGDDLGADDAADQGGLAAAGWAEDAGDGSGCDVNRDVFEGGALAADDGQVFDGDRG